MGYIKKLKQAEERVDGLMFMVHNKADKLIKKCSDFGSKFLAENIATMRKNGQTSEVEKLEIQLEDEISGMIAATKFLNNEKELPNIYFTY